MDPYRIEAEETSFEPATPVQWLFDVVGPQGRPRAYRLQHERELHLIVVRNDLSTFAHLHPSRREDERWEVELSLPTSGDYAAFADVAPDDVEPMTLRLALRASGDAGSEATHEPTRVSKNDGYRVALEGNVVSGSGSHIEFHLTKDGETVEPDPYLGAAGHLVAIRVGDLEYLHVHPMEGEAPGAIPFMIHAPGPGLYRLFLQFSHGGEVRTVDFTVQAGEAEGTASGQSHQGHSTGMEGVH